MEGYGPENIYWPENLSPPGVYLVSIYDFPWIGRPLSTEYVLLITVMSKTKKFTGTINLKEKKNITIFDKNNF
jgi:hypothetical protein